MRYVLEDPREFDRLEHQSKQLAYEPDGELKDLYSTKQSLSYQRILDAGCGSGLISRFLARHLTGAQILGVDASAERISQAQSHPECPRNVTFRAADLTSLPFSHEQFDLAICRYVVEHLNESAQRQALEEIKRCLKPGGQIRVIDFDGLALNLYPQSPRVAHGIEQIRASKLVDLEIGRKIPWLLAETGFVEIDWRIQTTCFKGEALRAEIEVMRERLALCSGALAPRFGGMTEYQLFCQEYVDSLALPETVLFYNKFIVDGYAPASPAPLLPFRKRGQS